MTKEELLSPRYKVIADYPKCLYHVGDIIRAGMQSEDLIYCDDKGTRMRNYPHLFRPLEWWEERTIDDMPMYIKMKEDGNIVKVREWNIGDDYIKYTYAYFDPISSCEVSHCIPATEEEYIEFKKK